MNKFFDSLPIRWKIILTVIIPMILSVYFSVDYIISSNNEAKQLNVISELSKLAVKSSELVHELQKERGRTAGFLNSKGSKFSSEIVSQREETNIFLNNFNNAIQNEEIAITKSSLTEELSKINQFLLQLDNIRSSIDNFSISTENALKYYTQTIGSLINIVDKIADESKVNSEISKLIYGYKSYLELKERNGILRATMTAVFAKNMFTPFLYSRAIEINAEMNVFYNDFVKKAKKEILEFESNKMNAPEVEQTSQYYNFAIKNHDSTNLGISPDLWFSTITKKIDKMKEVEDKIAETILSTATEYSEEAIGNRNFLIIFLIIIMFITVFLILLITKRISKRLALATEMAHRISIGDLTYLSKLKM